MEGSKFHESIFTLHYESYELVQVTQVKQVSSLTLSRCSSVTVQEGGGRFDGSAQGGRRGNKTAEARKRSRRCASPPAFGTGR
jgi:hypothetical protein